MHLVGDMKDEIPHPLVSVLKGRKIVLGSQSPRRASLLASLEIPFETKVSYASEEHGDRIAPKDIPLILAKRKADSLRSSLAIDEVLITADTVVVLDGVVLEKPKDLSEARTFLTHLSGRWHEVITGFCITTLQQQFSNRVVSRVRFNELYDDEIAFYLSRFEVLDKAGAYGIQDWIGLVGVVEVEGSFYNVMGLPTAQLYQDLKAFLSRF